MFYDEYIEYFGACVLRDDACVMKSLTQSLPSKTYY